VTFRGTEAKWLGGLQLISICIHPLPSPKAGDITAYTNLFCPA